MAKLILSKKLVTKTKLNALRKQEVSEKQPLQDIVIKEGVVTEKELTKLYAEEIDVPYIDLKVHDISYDALKRIPERVARRHNAIVFNVTESGIKQLAMEDPGDTQALAFLRKLLGVKVEVYITTATHLQAVLDQYRIHAHSELITVLTPQAPAHDPETVEEADVADNSPIAQTVNSIITYGIQTGASDIHIEPRADLVVVRYRIDGLLREANKFHRSAHALVVYRLKLLSGLSPEDQQTPQAGQFTIELAGQEYELRVSTLPILDGEKVVIQLQHTQRQPASLHELGVWGQARHNLEQAMIQPNGLLLVSGPIGAGKSTTLLSLLSTLNTPSVSIATIEDPIEYEIPGANQTQVNHHGGVSFSGGLQALLQQDPNIIMVSDLHDRETVALLMQAAQSGHLVLAAMHTTSASRSLPRLQEMGAEPFTIASTLRAVIGERLVRKLCLNCRQPLIPSAAELAALEQSFQLKHYGGWKTVHALEKVALSEGLVTTVGATTQHGIHHIWKANAHGCDSCHHSGYSGRIGLYEVLPSSPGLLKVITTTNTPEAIKNLMQSEGLVSLQLDGLIKALCGLTTTEEVLRVTTTA